MEKTSKIFIGPGTAGIAQRISASEEECQKLNILKSNKMTVCGQNQY